MQSIGFVDGIKQKDAFEFVLMALGSGNIPGESVPGRARKENLYSYLAQLLPLEHIDFQSYPSDAEKGNDRPRWEVPGVCGYAPARRTGADRANEAQGGRAEDPSVDDWAHAS